MSAVAGSLFAPPPATAKLILQDGTIIEGESFGAERSMSGEVCFSTAMVGYPEALTDPSFSGQILVLAFPLIGNYGVPSTEELDEFGLPKYLESNRVHITGLVVADYSPDYSHWNAAKSLGEWLRAEGVPAITGVDTRMLVKKIRDGGAMLGKIEFPGQPVAFIDPNARNLVAEVSTKAVRVFNPGSSPRVVAIDCGMKNNIIRYLARHGIELTVVPYNHDFSKEDLSKIDGLFVSNGPGDPTMAAETIATLRHFIKPAIEAAAGRRTTEYTAADRSGRIIPVFGICLGNQLLALAAGAKTVKMKFGNRSMNAPCVDLRTTRCYITPQNHGYAVDPDTLPPGWKQLFINANDLSNEGIVHEHFPFFSAQFHPEANGGPLDSEYLFAMFQAMVAGKQPAPVTTVDSCYLTSRAQRVRRVLLLGSGGLSIGQAGEFDFTCSQAIKALKEEGVEVVLINPNIATIQTAQGGADRVYLLPVTEAFALEVIKKERPDGIIISMGGQTALQVGLALQHSGALAEHGVRVLGTPTSAVVVTEDRELFSRALAEIGEATAKSEAATTVEQAVAAAARIGYPVLVRAAYALGGLGSGFADSEEELRTLVTKAFASTDQVLLDQDLRGWKELELEVCVDAAGNAIVVCIIENVDATGVHTGDSAVVAPCQTLTNSETFMLRGAAQKIARHVGVRGECNVQFALAPDSERYCVIEVNARLSRSSALASKATGYPLAWVATKLALGHDLVSLRNSVTKVTTACFEPALDYCVVKLPRWDLKKFGGRVDSRIGSAMKSVGEVMAIGRTFEEALSKAVRMVNPALDGFGVPATYEIASAKPAAGSGAGGTPADASATATRGLPSTLRGLREELSGDPAFRAHLDTKLRVPCDSRLYDIAVALACGYTVDRCHELTRIDRWFLHRMQRIVSMEAELEAWAEAGGTVDTLPPFALRRLKERGFGDRQIARRLGCSEDEVRRVRLRARIVPVTKQIDTLAAEFPAQTNYLYCTYGGCENDVVAIADAPDSAGSGGGAASSYATARAGRRTAAAADTATSLAGGGPVVVLGCGAYSIGNSVEFDNASVTALRTLRPYARTVAINYNPETVSTDYDECDRLYFEELSLERVLDICEAEKPAGVIVSLGGQIPQNLALPLHRRGVRILGTSPEDIDRAEDRKKFSTLCDRIGVDQPPWRELTSVEDAFAFADEVAYPVLVRPSYVLSGAAMRVASDREQLRSSLLGAAVVSRSHPVVISKFVLNAKEIEFDGVAKDGVILNYAISEHVENAGVHSGDATLMLPAQKLYVETIRQVKRISAAIARALAITGPFNIQLMAQENVVQVIECNLRASRTFPFISRVFDYSFIALATKVIVGLPAKPGAFSLVDLDYVAVKAPQFSFTRLAGADPTLGVEMVSTGEVAAVAPDAYEAFLLALMGAGFKLPSRTRNILVAASDAGKVALLDTCRRLAELGYHLYATGGTKAYLEEVGGIAGVTELAKPRSGRSPNVLEFLQGQRIDLVINDADAGDGEGMTDGYLIRRTAVDFGVSLLTNVKAAALLALALERVKSFHIRSIDEYCAGAPAASGAAGAAGRIGGSGSAISSPVMAAHRDNGASLGGFFLGPVMDAASAGAYRKPAAT